MCQTDPIIPNQSPFSIEKKNDLSALGISILWCITLEPGDGTQVEKRQTNKQKAESKGQLRPTSAN